MKTGKKTAFRSKAASGFILLLAMITALAACSGNKGGSGASPSASAPASSAAASQPASGGAAPAGTLVVANEDDLNTLDAPGAYGTHTIRTLSSVYESLVTQDETGKIVPQLATSWETSADGLTYTFKLRENVKFQDGTPFNADAVKFSFDRALDPKNEYYFGPYGFPNFYQPNIQSVDVVDANTVKFTMKQVDPTFLPNLIWSVFGIVSPEAVKKYGQDYPLHGAGTGPFQIVQWDKGSRLVTKAFTGYWGGAPKIESLIFKPVAEDAARLTQLQNGGIQVAAAMSPQLLPAIQAMDSLKTVVSPGIHTWFTILNTADGPFKDPKVRQAVNYAVDRDSLIKNLLHDTAEASSSFVWKNTWAYNPDSEIYNYDPDKAKQLLAEAGYANGLTLKYIVPASGSGMVAPVQIANVIQSDLAKVGVKVEITPQDWNTYLTTIGKGLSQPSGTYDMAQLSWMSTVDDPGTYANYFLLNNSTKDKPNGFNDGYYANPQVADLLTKAMQTINQDERAKLYKEAQVLVAQDAPWLFMFHSKNVIAMAKNVEGVTPTPNMNFLSFAKAELK